MNCQILFARKNKKNIASLSSAESAHGMVSVNFHLPIENISRVSVMCLGQFSECQRRCVFLFSQKVWLVFLFLHKNI